jgi:hypothetical protein
VCQVSGNMLMTQGLMVTVIMVVVKVMVGVVNSALLGGHYNQHQDRDHDIDSFDVEDDNNHDQHESDSNTRGRGP